VAALLSGESPYARRTYLDNELHQLPGSYLLAAPFAMAGASAIQNLVCVPLFFVLLAKHLRDPRTAAAIAGLVLLLSAAVSHAIITGSSYHWNAIWVLLGIWLIVRWPRSVWAAVFCGIAMCSRPNFMLLALPTAGFLWRTYGRDVTVKALGIVALTIAVLVVPLIFDPAPFSPINGFGRLEQLDEVARGAGVAILALTVIVAVMAMRWVDDERALFQSSAMIQLTPVVAGMIVGAWMDVATSLSFAGYASFASWFLLIANAAGVERDRSADAPGADEPA
jgi:hypothetical protein